MKKALVLILTVLVLASAAIGEETKSFCEYGKGVSSQLAATGGLWRQTWGEKAWDWFDCDAAPNVGFLGDNVVGLLQTSAAGPAVIDWTQFVVRLPLTGQLTLTALGDSRSQDGAGQILGDFTGTFVVDGLAAHAVVNEEAGTIRIAFGAAVEEGPDGLIEVTKTTGKFQSIRPVGSWEWHVNGTLTLARIPGLDLQLNILAALTNPLLILGAEEEIVLAGSYSRTSPKE